jgi:hypothetical protein
MMRRRYNFRMLKNINKTFKLLGIFALAAGFVSGCGSTLGGPARIPFCEVNTPPFSMEQPRGQTKLSVNPDGKVTTPDSKVTLAQGTYKYQKGEFYFNDQERHLMFEISHAKDINGKDVLQGECIGGNMGKDMEPFGSSMEIISDMKVNADGSAVVSKKRITFTIGPHLIDKDGNEVKGGAIYEIVDVDTDVHISLAKLYADYAPNLPSIDQAVFDLSGGNVQVRARLAEQPQEKNKQGKTVPTKSGIEYWTNTILKLETEADKAKANPPKK